MRQNRIYGITLTLSACGSVPEFSVAPPGTTQIAQQLILGFDARYDKAGTTLSVLVCLNKTGTCVIQSTPGKEDCHDYSGTEVMVDQIVIAQVEAGGYDVVGCTYPIFKAAIPRQQLTPGVSHQLTLKISGESTSLSIPEMFENRRMTLTGGKLVGGRDVSVTVEPRPIVLAAHTIEFDYNSGELDDQWCFAKHGWHGYDSSLATVPTDAWNAQGFSFRVPTNMPSTKRPDTPILVI